MPQTNAVDATEPAATVPGGSPPQSPDPSISDDQKFFFDKITSGSSELYKYSTTVASAFLGGTLLFLEKIAPSPYRWTLFLLAAGWASLVACLAFVAAIQYYNMHSGIAAALRKWDEAGRIDQKTIRLTHWSIVSLIAGMLLLMTFGFVNVCFPKESGGSNVATRPAA